MDDSSVFCPHVKCLARGKVGPGTIVLHSRKRPRYRWKTWQRALSAREGTMRAELRIWLRDHGHLDPAGHPTFPRCSTFSPDAGASDAPLSVTSFFTAHPRRVQVPTTLTPSESDPALRDRRFHRWKQRFGQSVLTILRDKASASSRTFPLEISPPGRLSDPAVLSSERFLSWRGIEQRVTWRTSSA